MRRYNAFLVLILLLCTFIVYGRQMAYDGKGITLMITPETVCLGGEVTISGTSAPGRNSRTITATFKPPGRETVTRTFSMQPDGMYTYTEKSIDVTGTWKVTVKGPVIKETAAGQFEVLWPTASSVASIGVMQEGVQDSLKLLTEMKNQSARFPKLAQKEQAASKMDELESTYNDINNDLQQVSSALESINAVIGDLAPFPETQAVMGALSGQLQNHQKEMQTVRRELKLTYEEANNAREWCRMWFAQKQGLKIFFKAVQAILSCGKSLTTWIATMAKNYIKNMTKQLTIDNMLGQTNLTPQQKAAAKKAILQIDKAVNMIQKVFGDENAKLEFKKDIAFMGIDYLIEWISGIVAKNCRVYKGDVKGKLTVDFYAKGVVYMTAKYRFNGGIELFFQKRRHKNDIVRLQGQVWGNFGWRIGQYYPERLAPKVPGMWAFGLCVPRPPYVDMRDFFLVLEGEGKPEEIEVEVIKASYDKEWLKYRFISILWSPYQLVPAVDFPSTAIPGGHWFVTRVTNTAGNQKKFKIPLSVGGDKTILKHTFKRTMDYRKESEFIAALELEIKGNESKLRPSP